MKKQKNPKKRFVRMTYDHIIVRVCLYSPVGTKVHDLKKFSAVKLVATLFETTPLKVAKDVARLSAGLEDLFEKERAERKARQKQRGNS